MDLLRIRLLPVKSAKNRWFMELSFGLREGRYSRPAQRLSVQLYRVILGAVMLSSLCAPGEAQDLLSHGDVVVAPGNHQCDLTAPVPCFQHIAQDEVGLTQSVFHIKRSSLPVIFGIAVATGVSLHFDKQMSQALTGLPTNPKPLGREADIVGVYGPVGMGGILYLAGSVFHNFSRSRDRTSRHRSDGRCGSSGRRFEICH
jgi:hypothetical protein